MLAICLACCALPVFPVAALADPVLSVDGDSAVDAAAGFGIEGFHRAKRGSDAALPDGQQVGYRYITGAADNFVLMACEGEAVLYVPAEKCAELGIDLGDPGQASALAGLVGAVDAANADGGTPFDELGLPLLFTSECEFSTASCEYRFAVPSEGRFYAAAEPVGGSDRADRADRFALFCDYGSLAPASALSIVSERGLLEELALFFGRIDWSPLFVSARTTVVATAIVFAFGTLAGWLVARMRGSRAKSVLDVVFTIPMVLPPTVCGFLLLYATGKNSGLGQWLISIGVNVPFTWPAAVISAMVVSFPFMYRAARGGLESVDVDLLDAARTLGWSEWRVFFRLALPLSAPSLAAGVMLAFARALGEFGATMFFAGNYAGVTQTIPLAIYYDWMGGDVASAGFWTAVMIAFTLIAFPAINHFSRRR